MGVLGLDARGFANIFTNIFAKVWQSQGLKAKMKKEKLSDAEWRESSCDAVVVWIGDTERVLGWEVFLSQPNWPSSQSRRVAASDYVQEGKW